MALNPEFEETEQKRLKTGFIMQLSGFAAAFPTGPIGMVVTLMGMWKVATAVTDEKKKRWRIYLITGIVCALLEVVWLYFAVNWLFNAFSGGGGAGGGFDPLDLIYGPGVG